jgi:hypothetical protein
MLHATLHNFAFTAAILGSGHMFSQVILQFFRVVTWPLSHRVLVNFPQTAAKDAPRHVPWVRIHRRYLRGGGRLAQPYPKGSAAHPELVQRTFLHWSAHPCIPHLAGQSIPPPLSCHDALLLRVLGCVM